MERGGGSTNNIIRGRNRDPLIGIVLLKRFEIISMFSKDGAYGELYNGIDYISGKEVLIKVTKRSDMNMLEHSILTCLNMDIS